ncbi:MAG: hypothetical protein GY742_06170 [Hyphomicrobiales bacterium]|nr:hypothetical protein [Hyphomicrobiales bacterium]
MSHLTGVYLDFGEARLAPWYEYHKPIATMPKAQANPTVYHMFSTASTVTRMPYIGPSESPLVLGEACPIHKHRATLRAWPSEPICPIKCFNVVEICLDPDSPFNQYDSQITHCVAA